jgi:AP-1-like factor
LFGGFAGKQSNVDFNVLMMGSQSSSPVIHHRSSPETSGSSSSSASTSNTSHQSPTSSAGTSPDHDFVDEKGEFKRCPRTKEEAVVMLNNKEPSVFVKESTLHKEEVSHLGNIVACKGSSLPSTTPRADDIEVLTAWRGVTANPNFKDADINTLCSEFSSKARCDGSRVVVKDPVISNYLLNWLRSVQVHNNILDYNR